MRILKLSKTILSTIFLYLISVGYLFAQEATAQAVAEEAGPSLNSGDTAWVMVSTALVLMMTIPGVALFYGGMVRKKNVLATTAQSFSFACLGTVIWIVIGYSLAFSDGGALNSYIGGLSNLFLVSLDVSALSGTIPESVFMTFQMTFAIITPALIMGAFADRIKFSSAMVFLSIWLVVVYAPICHWVWGGGFLGDNGVLDFAGGTVVHINSGIAGLVGAIVIGKRKGYGTDNMSPHNLALSLIGASLLWVGWFGFNAGSALAADTAAGMAFAVTQIAASTAAIGWLVMELIIHRKPSVLGVISGAIAGLVAITPAAGFVSPSGALFIGFAAGIVCFLASTVMKRAFGYDDSLDVFGIHGVGGIVGAILTGVFAVEAIGGTAGVLEGNLTQLWIQIEGILATIVYCAIATYIILKAVDLTMGLRVPKAEEIEGLDINLHGETVS